MTDRTKTICPPIFDLGGIIKKNMHQLYIKHLDNVKYVNVGNF